MKRNCRLDRTIQRIMGGAASREGVGWEDDHSPSIANSVPRSSSPPTVTTSVPGAGPSLRTATSPWTDATVIGARTNVSGPALVYVHVPPSTP